MQTQENTPTKSVERVIKPLSLTKFPPLSEVTAELIDSEQFGFYIGLKRQTIAKQLCEGKTLVRPVYIGKRPMFRVADVKKLIAGEVA